jgi:hypothetical protein
MANVENYVYEVDENNAVRIWDSNVVRDGGNQTEIPLKTQQQQVLGLRNISTA